MLGLMEQEIITSMSLLGVKRLSELSNDLLVRV